MTDPRCPSAPWTSGRFDPGSALQTGLLGTECKHGRPEIQGFLYQSEKENRDEECYFSIKQQRNDCVWFTYDTYLSESVAVSFSGCGDDDLLFPVLAVEVFQVFLDGLQSGQFSREVNGCDGRVVGVPVYRFLQGLVDFIQRAQEELKKTQRRRGGVKTKISQ